MKDRDSLPSHLHVASCVAASLVTLGFLALYCPAQEKKYPPVESVDAHAIFRAYCAPCHGLDAQSPGLLPLMNCFVGQRPALRLRTYCSNPRTDRRTTIKDVRYYTTKPMNGGTTFKCTFCDHRVTTLDFQIANGNRRTQAAAEINQHVALSHSRASRTTMWYPKGLIPIEQEARL